MKMTNVFFKSLVMAIVFTFQVGAMKASVVTLSIDATGISVVADQKAEAVVLRINNPDKQRLKITLYDTKKQSLYEEKVNQQSTYSKKLKLNLPNGQYFLSVEDEDGMRIYPITITDEKVEVDYKNIEKISRPVFKQIGDKLQIRLSASHPETVKVIFIGDNKQSFFTDKVAFVQQFNRLYNLKELPRGSYTIRIDTADLVTYKKIEVK